ncbi:(2Fe-2S)-binding protein [Paenibacillus beijingensis]|uniref:(2Fe-2S)-binding protein n=1 Tax=Paenibacillus beijingensis TaxID=1126833 RepID=A0A0D5NRJ5_9BACL|nr:FAD-dependent oxidoreductase [Paenibacillus beijingensis]AJY77954.1 (2Fe-2S)-binding protein [Paenibacillus beijingensis]
MPASSASFWLASTEVSSFDKLTTDLTVDVAVVGGGITGISLAYLLAKEGKQVALLDAGRLLNGTTGNTTAKITAQHDLIYDELIHHIGEEKARLYYEANDEAIAFIRNTVLENKISCDFAEENAYIYTTAEANIAMIDKEWKAYEKLGIPGLRADRIPLPVDAKASIVMPNQARFHPLAYLKHLIKHFINNGGQIFEETTAMSINPGSPLTTVVTRDGTQVKCRDVVSCSHFPFYDVSGFYFARLYAERAYVLGVKLNGDYPGGMYLSADSPPRSIRSVSFNGEDLLLVGGERHKTGQGICTMKHYERLETFVRDTFGSCEIPYRWSAQDLTTLDKVPYIGHVVKNEPHAYIATGYRKWGMTSSTAAALLLKDMILGIDNRYEDLYTPSRFYADPSLKTFLVENADVAKHLINGKLEWVTREPEDVRPDEGAVVRVNGKRAGAYREADGTLYVVDTTCTHMGCEVQWNAGERTWDCPCHGSRFSFSGEVIEGPAKKSLKQIEY